MAEHYPLDRYGGSVPLAYSAAVTDGVFACVADRMSDDLAATDPVYAYEFNDRSAPAPDSLRTLPFPVGASHSFELRYLFDVGGAPPLNPAQQALSDQMIDYWSEFVADGLAERRGPAGLARRQASMSLQPDGSQRHHRLRTGTPVPVLGRAERGEPDADSRPGRFRARWVQAWNAHDVDGLVREGHGTYLD